MRIIGFDQLYLEDYHITQLFATNQRWKNGAVFATQRTRKISLPKSLQYARKIRTHF